MDMTPASGISLMYTCLKMQFLACIFEQNLLLTWQRTEGKQEEKVKKESKQWVFLTPLMCLRNYLNMTATSPLCCPMTYVLVPLVTYLVQSPHSFRGQGRQTSVLHVT